MARQTTKVYWRFDTYYKGQDVFSHPDFVWRLSRSTLSLKEAPASGGFVKAAVASSEIFKFVLRRYWCGKIYHI